LTQVERNRVHHASDRLETARTVAALLREQSDLTTDDMSTLTLSINNPGNGQADNNHQRHMAQVSLQGISLAMN
jgi:hypothetical protein